MDIPADWISETELAAATRAVDRKRFHRNLLNWRHHGLLLERYDGISVADAIRHLGVGVGNEAWYPPVYLPMVRRINELRQRQPKDMDEWFWQLWLDDYPVDVIGWCRRRLERFTELAAAISTVDRKRLHDEATRKPKRSDPRGTIYRQLKTGAWYDLMTGMAEMMIDRPAAGVFFDVLAMLVRSKDVIPAARAVSEHLRAAPLLAVLESVSEDEVKEVRKAFRELQAAALDGPFASLLSPMWKKVDLRAPVLPLLVVLYRACRASAAAIGQTEAAG
jgi:hypothetical protein